MARREVLVQLDDDLVQRLDDLATRLGTNRSELLRRGAQAVISAEELASVLTAVTCAPITRTIRGIRSEVELGPEHGLPERCAISLDNVITVPLGDLDADPIGHLDEIARAQLDRAPRYALDIVY